MHDVLALRIYFPFAHCGHVQTQTDYAEDTRNFDVSELGHPEAEECAYEGYIDWQDWVPDDSFDPVAHDHAEKYAEQRTSKGHSNEIAQNSNSRRLVSLS